MNRKPSNWDEWCNLWHYHIKHFGHLASSYFVIKWSCPSILPTIGIPQQIWKRRQRLRRIEAHMYACQNKNDKSWVDHCMKYLGKVPKDEEEYFDEPDSGTARRAAFQG